MLGVERLTYEVFYGILLNKQLAMAAHSIPTAWGIKATFNGLPNLVMFEAESEFGGEDAGDRMNQAIADLKIQEGVNKFGSSFGNGQTR